MKEVNTEILSSSNNSNTRSVCLILTGKVDNIVNTATIKNILKKSIEQFEDITLNLFILDTLTSSVMSAKICDIIKLDSEDSIDIIKNYMKLKKPLFVSNQEQLNNTRLLDRINYIKIVHPQSNRIVYINEMLDKCKRKTKYDIIIFLNIKDINPFSQLDIFRMIEKVKNIDLDKVKESEYYISKQNKSYYILTQDDVEELSTKIFKIDQKNIITSDMTKDLIKILYKSNV